MTEGPSEAPKNIHPARQIPDNQQHTSSKNIGRLRHLVREQQEVAQKKHQKDAKRPEPDPASAFLGIAIEKVRADLASQYDKKTGLRNHDVFLAETEREMAKVTRNPDMHGLVIGMQDIDKFGIFNSTYGEQTGDVALRQVAQVLNESIRDTDLSGRWGGEEFAFALPYDKEPSSDSPANFHHERKTTDLTPAGERMRRAVESMQTSDELPEQLTVSVGLSEYIAGESFKACFERASLATLIAKLTGKNRSVMARQDSTGEWDYYDQTNHVVYRPTMSLDGKRLVSIEDITQNIPYSINYNNNNKPELVKLAA